MVDIWEVIAELALELHPDRVEGLARLIASINSNHDFPRIRRQLSPNINTKLIDCLEKGWNENQKISASEIASALMSASFTAKLAATRGSIEMVWTGPSSSLLPIRHTEQVLREVIDGAKTKLFIISFVAYDVPTVNSALNRAIERNVSVDILVESSQNHRARIQVDSVPKMKRAVPKANIYIWDQSINSEIDIGVVHAKCAIADDCVAFITSANLTTAAMERNLEVGVLIKGGDLPIKLDQNLRSLIISGVLQKSR